MKYLVAIPPEHGSKGDWAQADEPLVPWYPATMNNWFVGCSTFKPASLAVVKDVQTLDVDVLAANLAKQYPGLPRELHDNYVLATARLARQLRQGTRLRIFITPDTARVQELDGTEQLHTLWEEQPLP